MPSADRNSGGPQGELGAMRTPEEGIEDLKQIEKLGLRGVMMPGNPGVEDYDSHAYDGFYETAIGLGMPLSFHILTSSSDGFSSVTTV